MKNYFDTCVLVAYYCPEEISGLVENELINSLFQVISSLTVVEFYSAIAKKIRKNELPLKEAQQIINKFNNDIKNSKYKNISIFSKHYLSAKKWLASFDVTLYTQDALHLAITYHAGYKLITTDIGLSKAAKHIGIDCKFLSKTTL